MRAYQKVKPNQEQMTIQTAAYKWGISRRRVSQLCQDGRIPGAQKQGIGWVIPSNTPKPEDGRTGRHAKNASV